MSRVFVTASGTEIGKTFVTRALIAQLRAKGRLVQALKPIATGVESVSSEPSDTELLLHALDREADAGSLARVTPWCFREPLSPDMAATREQTTIPFDDLVAFCKAESGVDITLIEGIGGVMVPLDEEHSVLDWIVTLGAPTLLVVGSYLGALSHALTAAGMLRASGVELAGIIVNESPEEPVPTEETAAVIARFSADVPIRVLHRVDRIRTAQLQDCLADLNIDDALEDGIAGWRNVINDECGSINDVALLTYSTARTPADSPGLDHAMV